MLVVRPTVMQNITVLTERNVICFAPVILWDIRLSGRLLARQAQSFSATDMTATTPTGEPTTAENQTETITTKKAVYLNKAHDITPFCSTDPSRYVIQGVHLNAVKKRLEATNGQVLVTVPVVEGDAAEFPPVSTPAGEPTDCIIEAAPLKKALANIPKKVSLPILKHARLDVNGKVTLTTTDLENEQAVTAKTIEGQYPDIDVATPSGDDYKLSICLSAHLLKTIAEYFAKNSPDGKQGITLKFKDSLSPVLFSGYVKGEAALSGDLKASGVLMPMRMA